MVNTAKKPLQLQAELGLFEREGQQWSATSHDLASPGFGPGDCGDWFGTKWTDKNSASLGRWSEGKAVIKVKESRL